MEPKAEVDLMEIDDALEALAFRAVLESWNVRVALHLIGQAQDVVRLLSGKQRLSRRIFWMGHGDDQGFILPELHPGFERDQLYHSRLTPDNLKEFLTLSDCIVISTCCETGAPPIAKTFLQAGCQAYIGPVGSPQGDASLFYLTYLCYEWICKNSDLKTAHEQASSHDEETAKFRLHER